MTCELALRLHLSYFNRAADCRMRPTYDENIRHFLGPGEIKAEAIGIEYKSTAMQDCIAHTLRNRNNAKGFSHSNERNLWT